jgi:lipopolysaccharide/colanic/teichoic acid biosynthesis glycosyltransferase
MQERSLNKMHSKNSYFSVDVLVALFLFAFALPACIFISLVSRIKLGKPIFYKGDRLGKDKKIFSIYKFRTLPDNAQKDVIGAELLSDKHNLTTPFTEFLRDTRLDELPQLWNVIKGDMSFIGPRPERPEIYDKLCKEIPNYDKRFLVKPGLLGYSQLFTPHGTPKKLRTLVDNSYISHQTTSTSWMLKIIFYTAWMVCIRVFEKSKLIATDFFYQKILNRYHAKRKLVRKTLPLTLVEIHYLNPDSITEIVSQGKLININSEAFLVHTNHKLPEHAELVYSFIVPNIKRRSSRAAYKIAKCYGGIVKAYETHDSNYQYGYVIFYEALSPLNTYLIQQYILQTSLAY